MAFVLLRPAHIRGTARVHPIYRLTSKARASSIITTSCMKHTHNFLRPYSRFSQFKIEGLRQVKQEVESESRTFKIDRNSEAIDEWEWVPPIKNISKALDVELASPSEELANKSFVLDSSQIEIPIIEGQPLNTEEIITVIRNNNGQDIQCLEISGKTNIAENMIIASAKSHRHVQKISREILYEFKRRRLKVRKPEQRRRTNINYDWVSLDLGKNLVNIFLPEIRDQYELESIFDETSRIEDPDLHMQSYR